MQLSRFEALALLPDSEIFTCYRLYSKTRGETLLMRRFQVGIQDIHRTIKDGHFKLASIQGRKDVGVVIMCNKFTWLKADKKKVQRFTKQNKCKVPSARFSRLRKLRDAPSSSDL